MADGDKKVIIFAGPPSVGKNTAAIATVQYIKSHAKYLNPERRSLATPLKDAVHKMFGIPYDGSYFDDERNRILKDKPHPLLFGKTPRRVYIDMSKLMHDKYNEDIFGRIAANAMHNSNNKTFIFSSGGTSVNEWAPIIDWLTPENVLYIELHSPGKEFGNDSRSYLGERLQAAYPKLQVSRIVNNITTDPFDKELFLIMVRGTVKKFLGIEES